MTSYQSKTRIVSDLQSMLPHQIEECRTCDELPAALEELIKHNFQATFVCYDKKSHTIEVGVEEQEEVNSYPDITVHKFGLDEVISQIKRTFRKADQDLKFYGKLLAGYSSSSPIDEVVLV